VRRALSFVCQTRLDPGFMSAPLGAQVHHSICFLSCCRLLAGRSQSHGGLCSHHAGAALGGACRRRGTAAGQLPGELCFWPLCPLHPGPCTRPILSMCCCHTKRCSFSGGTTTGACCCCRHSCHINKRRRHSQHAAVAARAFCPSVAAITSVSPPAHLHLQPRPPLLPVRLHSQSASPNEATQPTSSQPSAAAQRTLTFRRCHRAQPLLQARTKVGGCCTRKSDSWHPGASNGSLHSGTGGRGSTSTSCSSVHTLASAWTRGRSRRNSTASHWRTHSAASAWRVSRVSDAGSRAFGQL
jgi:hypothetical protein